MQPIHWYPGHMAKAKRQLEELIRYLDLILEVRDARIPATSHNSDLEPLLKKRPNIIILNKIDLADPVITESWSAFFTQQKLPHVKVNGKTGQGLSDIWRIFASKVTVTAKKPFIRIGVVGIPNVGKSSILNRLIGAGSAKTGNTPGVTRGKQWVRKNGVEILDTPGLLPPKIANPEDGVKMALVGTIREEIIPAYDLAIHLLERYGEKFLAGEEGNLKTPEEKLASFAKRRGFVIKGGELDLNRTVSTILKEFRDGRLARISLETPSLPLFPGND